MAIRPSAAAVVLIACAGLTLSPAPAAAQEGGGPHSWMATALSGGTALIGLGLVPVAAQFDVPEGAVYGAAAATLLILGPSTGFVYAGRRWRGAKSVLLRVGAVGMILAGVSIAWNEDDPVGAILALGGAGLAAGSILYDVFTVGPTAREVRSGRVQVGLLPGGFGARVSIGY